MKIKKKSLGRVLDLTQKGGDFFGLGMLRVCFVFIQYLKIQKTEGLVDLHPTRPTGHWRNVGSQIYDSSCVSVRSSSHFSFTSALLANVGGLVLYAFGAHAEILMPGISSQKTGVLALLL